jgi:rhodanese-related sulfurtransferase
MVLEGQPNMLQASREVRQSGPAGPITGVSMSRRRNSDGQGGTSLMRRVGQVLLVVVVLPILIGGVVLLFTGRSVAFEVLRWRTQRKFPEVSWLKTDSLDSWVHDPLQPHPVLLDARTQDEFAVSRIRSAAQIDPYRPSLRPVQKLPKDTAIVVYSSAGYRGARVASWLARAGYSNVHNLAGGIFAWVNEGRPVFRGENPTAQVHPYDRIWGRLVLGQYRAEAPDVAKQSAAP